MKKKQASTTIYIIFFFIMFLAFSAFAVDASIVLTQRAKLQNITEQTALAAASYFNDSSATIGTKAQDIFKILSQDSLQYAHAAFKVNVGQKMILVESNVVAQPIFLSFLGVSGVNLSAKSCAISNVLDIAASHDGNVSWLTPNAVYYSNILTDTDNTNDTDIRTPLGEFASASMPSIDSMTPDYTLISKDSDRYGLNLGPGGYVTIRLPAPVIDKAGNDIYIKEAGDAQEGYSVYAGLDINPKNPYVKSGTEGDGILWTNISCTGTSEDNISGAVLSDKVYGSANFDIGKSCDGHLGVSMVKYLRIIDDNEEVAFMKNQQGNYKSVALLGESSTSTAGADISCVRVLNYVSLMKPSLFVN